MKRLIISLFVLMGVMMAMPLTASAASSGTEVSVVMPEYKCTINGSSVYFKDQQYPILNYKGITYFPMTWNHCRYMDLVSDWIDGSGLYIASKPNANEKNLGSYPLKKGTVNKSEMTARTVNYPVYINGEPAPKDSTYPLLNFRGITYFPMTWTYSHDCLGWELTFIADATKPYREFIVNTLPDSFVWTYGKVSGNTLEYYKVNSSYADEDNMLFTVDMPTGKTIVTNLTEEKSAELETPDSEVSLNDRLVLKGNDIYLDGTKIRPVAALENGSTTADDVELAGREVTDNGVTYIMLYAYNSLSVPAPYTPVEIYTYLKTDKGYAYIDKDLTVFDIGKAGKNTFVSAKVRTGFRAMVYDYYRTYVIDDSGNATCLNNDSRFKNFGSVQLIGTANGKACLKCIWAPNKSGNDGDERNLEVAPYNDGFYAFDGSGLKQIRKYVYVSDAYIGANGDIYGFNPYKNKMKKIGVLK